MAHRCRGFYEAWGVRLSILAAAYADTPYTLMQIGQTQPSINPLADGAGHTFLKLSPSSWTKTHTARACLHPARRQLRRQTPQRERSRPHPPPKPLGDLPGQRPRLVAADLRRSHRPRLALATRPLRHARWADPQRRRDLPVSHPPPSEPAPAREGPSKYGAVIQAASIQHPR